MICKHIFVGNIFNESEHFLYANGFSCCSIAITIKHQSFVYTYMLEVISFFNELDLIYLDASMTIVSTQLNSFNYC